MPRDLMPYFRLEARELYQSLSQDTLTFESQPNAKLLARLLRHAHTLKGAARVVKQELISEKIHQFEEILSAYRDAPESFPSAEVDQLLRLLDEIAAAIAALEPVAAVAPDPAQPVAAAAPAKPRVHEDGGFSLLSHQGVEVDALLQDLRAANGQVEVLRRNLQEVERSKTLAELLLAQLAGDGVAKGARFVAEELQAQLRSVEHKLTFGVDQIERELGQIRDSTEKLRLVRADALFPTLRRVLRDAAVEQGLQAELETRGGELRLDPQLLAAVQGALIQAVRNSLAHGIETPEQRRAAGKANPAKVAIEVVRRGRRIHFCCHDDGRGVDLVGVRQSLADKGLASQDLSDAAVLERLLGGGISTSAEVTQAAGRGIGLNLIHETALSLGGQARLTSHPGQSTSICLDLPWSVAGMDFLELSTRAAGKVDPLSVLIPLDCVRSALRLQPEDISKESDGETIVYEGQGLRLVSLSAVLQTPDKPGLAAVVLRSSLGLMALSAGSLRGTRVASLLPLPPWTRASELLAGAVLDADGNAQLVLDPEGLFREASRLRAPRSAVEPLANVTLLVIDDSLTTRVLQQSILESAGFLVDLACSAEEGLEKLREKTYGLILVDVEMPGMDGFCFVEQLRADPALSHIPAILVTSRDAAEDRLRGQTVGAQGYMVKSQYDQKVLLRLIRGLLA